MKRTLFAGLLCVALFGGLLASYAAETITGAGATFPYPVYSKWADKYNKLTGVQLNYQSIGSGGGIAQIKAKTVDFGASDAPMKADELKKEGLIQFPMIIGGVVPVINIKGIKSGEIKLTPDLLAEIYLGKIRYWDDGEIKKVNSGVKLPHQAITVVHRADGSGTTWIFTNYLDKVSKEWHEKVGTDKAVSWPTGVGAKGNEGVAAQVQKLSGSIGYVEYAYALQNKLPYAQLRNKAGKYVNPTSDAFQAACSNADWKGAAGYYVVLTDQPGDKSWPITGASFILVHKAQKNAATAQRMLEFFDWSYKNGGKMAEELDYVPVPDSVVNLGKGTESWRQAGLAIAPASLWGE
jgi:phosphate transport system substrate-binding protein